MIFREGAHQYLKEGTDDEYIPVTTFVHKFQEYVDWDKACRIKAHKLGITFEELRRQWDDKRDRAAAKGTAYHKQREEEYKRMYTDAGHLLVDDKPCKLSYMDTREGVKWDQQDKLEDNTVYVEKMIWSDKYKVCGTADLVEVVDGRIHIKDYKTNEKLDFNSWVHPKDGPKKLLFPVHDLDDCSFNVYQLQLNLYMYMLLRHNRHLKQGSMTLLHVQYNEDGTYKQTVQVPVGDLQKHVHSMLETYMER